MTPAIQTAKASYRSLLRELPRRTLNAPTPLQTRIRDLYNQQPSHTTTTTSQETKEDIYLRRIDEANQFAEYAKAQRVYAELVERYNPGMTLDEEERIRLTARRVGLDLPIEADGKEGKNN
ncbi:hypothetical protein ASPCADRAFT_3851 [Aspergillus carbonarius ITEM 5010]|uniref:ATP synthase assembly factor FMC1, mitochondrial n=1 Tax=Aspergillus carbonarius (strain ITEM 5010) TaxID=602072 RepID=A0A1R3RRZ0_ASPC5|nr:hypothetical protein ASPCADRAFT_3851 [Aspergillus carbonarius ITEM 5010]